jgi:probable rRNA maturation factor
MIEVDLSVEPMWHPQGSWQNVADRGVVEVLSVAGISDDQSLFSVSIRLADNNEVQALNRDYRQKDKPTNVLSFPMLDEIELDKLRHLNPNGPDLDGAETMLGDIILAYETCKIEAAEKGISLPDHVTHLVIHGTLHLLGYDHVEDAEAEIMEALEVKALASLGLGNPYSA